MPSKRKPRKPKFRVGQVMMLENLFYVSIESLTNRGRVHVSGTVKRSATFPVELRNLRPLTQREVGAGWVTKAKAEKWVERERNNRRQKERSVGPGWRRVKG